ncbi:lanthionine synthetase LanC family protein [Croceivirga thetidis]|uniref:Lanthionine synthetase n=1 Tax=Croceivirga thetidis TaxID=2721623 RepID=A0ABX1GP00_9FLAO|nr:lanthionine synthetase LanC family protein [Croceivirga thetidis]NKI30790.1 hypothetical protein [Croceivirga thetidis]
MINNSVEQPKEVGSSISKEKRLELEAQVKQLAIITKNSYEELEHIGVLGGLAGVALFQFYCAHYFDEDSYSETGVEIITRCMERINEGYSYTTYCNGIAGFGWTLQLLQNLDFIDLDLDELLTPFDDFLHQQMKLDFQNNYYDALHGALGYGIYFIKRFNSPKTSSKTKEHYKEIIIELLSDLENLAEKDRNGLKWKSTLNSEIGTKGYNLSLSHGMSSIVYVLFKIHEAGIEKERVQNLVEGATTYILSCEKNTDEGISQFPSWINPTENPFYHSRLAWCYGDLGIGKAIQWSSSIQQKPQLKLKAKELLLKASLRKTEESSYVVDAGYCHGSFGNAHIFQQLGFGFNEEQFLATAAYWLDDGLKRRFKDDNQPYKQWVQMENKHEFKRNLLEGISGIGLSMLDFLTESESKWDESLMLR